MLHDTRLYLKLPSHLSQYQTLLSSLFHTDPLLVQPSLEYPRRRDAVVKYCQKHCYINKPSHLAHRLCT